MRMSDVFITEELARRPGSQPDYPSGKACSPGVGRVSSMMEQAGGGSPAISVDFQR